MGVSDTDSGLADAYAQALVGEIKAEMGRQRIGGVRALARLMGRNSHGSLNDRLNKNSKTGKPVPISQSDLWEICAALNVEPHEMVRRAAVVAYGGRRPADETPTTEAG